MSNNILKLFRKRLSSLEQIKTTKNRLEFDQKTLMTEISHRRMLTFELDQNIEYYILVMFKS